MLKNYRRNLLLGMQRLTEDKFVGFVQKRRDAVILDIGCGDGNLTIRVAQKIGARATVAIEKRYNIAMQARRRGIEVVLADANRPLPFREEAFDIIVSNQVIEHLDNTDMLPKEINRTLKKGGYCAIATPNLGALHNILSLVMGLQPPTSHVSDELFACGNPFNPDDGIVVKHCSHRRIFTSTALKALFEYHGLKCEKLAGFGMHPLPIPLSRFINSRRYSAIIAIRARKI